MTAAEYQNKKSGLLREIEQLKKKILRYKAPAETISEEELAQLTMEVEELEGLTTTSSSSSGSGDSGWML